MLQENFKSYEKYWDLMQDESGFKLMLFPPMFCYKYTISTITIFLKIHTVTKSFQLLCPVYLNQTRVFTSIKG